MPAITWKTVAAAGVVTLVLYEYGKGEIKAAAKEAGEAVNPTSRKNIFNQALEKTGQTVTGEKDWTLGGQIAEWTDSDQRGDCFRKVPDGKGGYKAQWYKC